MSTRPSGAPPAHFDWTKPLRNAGRLAAGRGVQAVCSLVYLAVAARALGPTDFGSLVLIHSLALAIALFSSFGSKEMLVRFGSLALTGERDVNRLSRLIWYGVGLDLLGTLLAWLFMALASDWALAKFGLAESVRGLTLTYWFAAVAVVNLSQSSNGILRLFDRFQLLAYQSTVEPLLRLVAVVVVVQLGSGLAGFLLGWLIALLGGRICLVLLALHTLRKEQLGPFARPTFKQSCNPEPGIWRFVLWLQWSTTMSLADTQLPVLAIGTLANNSSAGLFKVAQQITAVLERANSKLLVPSLYTELAHLSAAGEEAKRRHLVRKITACMLAAGCGIFVVLVFLGKPLLTLMAGPQFVGAYAVVLWLSAAGVINALGVTFEPLLIAAGKVRIVAVAGTLPLLVYVPMLFGLIGPFGLAGVGMATVVYALLNTAILLFAVRRTLRSQEAGQPL